MVAKSSPGSRSVPGNGTMAFNHSFSPELPSRRSSANPSSPSHLRGSTFIPSSTPVVPA